MKTRTLTRVISLLTLIVSASGCTTASLWKGGDLEAWNEPAYQSNVRLYCTPSTNDFLVVYDEYHERSGKACTRAYWLNENQNRVAERHTPHFVSTNLVSCLRSVPVFTSFSDEINLPRPCALVETNGQSFTLYPATGEKSRHDLPFYNDGKGKPEKILLTPVAVTADLTIVGGVVGYICLEAWAQSGASYSWKP